MTPDPDVEDAGIRRQGHGLTQQAPEDAAPGADPPVGVRARFVFAMDDGFQRRKWIWSHMRATVHNVRGMWLGRTVVCPAERG